jgi:hypothetical protein
MKDRNENQSKHISNSFRIVGMAGFATFGYQAIQESDFVTAIFFGLVYLASEYVAYHILNKGVEKCQNKNFLEL